MAPTDKHEARAPAAGDGDASFHLAITLLLWVLALGTLLLGPRDGDGLQAPRPVRAAIDPNRAPWWELTMLPRIGEHLARRVVRFRELGAAEPEAGAATPVFRCPADLEGVRGIGPKTVQRITPFMEF